MKIQPINNTQNFRGLFVDCSKENGGDWKMVYRPYSWEVRDSKTPIMAKKESIDIVADYLPDNEEIFIPMRGIEPEVSKDILGTVSYYKYTASYNNGEMRRQIIFGEPLSREESLQVYDKKLEEFVKMKLEEQRKIALDINDAPRTLDSVNEEFRNSSWRYEDTSFGYNAHKRAMDKRHKEMFEYAKTVCDQAMKYIKINASLDSIKQQRAQIQAELEMINNARQDNNLIDISKRHVPDPNKPYWQALVEALNNENIRLNTDKVVVFPHTTKTLKSLIEGWFKGYNTTAHFNEDVLRRIPDELMSRADSAIYHFKRYKKNLF